jgi:hypothetical protein
MRCVRIKQKGVPVLGHAFKNVIVFPIAVREHCSSGISDE